MAVSIYLWGITLTAILCWLLVAIIIFKTDPRIIDIKIFIIFFASLFLATLASLTYIGYWFRLMINKKEIIPKHNLLNALRQAVLISLAGIGLLLLQATRVLSWWDGILLVSAVLLLELYFKSK